MLPFFVLLVATMLFRLAGIAGVPLFDNWPGALRGGLAVMFFLTASAHWGKRRPDLIRMVPPALPRPDLLVTITGVLEILGAIGLLIPSTARTAATGLALLLVPMFAANVHAVQAGVSIAGTPATKLPLRAALQVVFIAALIVAGWA